jgi:hypothetical protein
VNAFISVADAIDSKYLRRAGLLERSHRPRPAPAVGIRPSVNGRPTVVNTRRN